ncbi:uncharacterized protein LOC136025289 [Artemia franciscana]|uniref:uncharacterized protein LOC136025289 n=1 Tax=Artemia franciscana TaxID=6661 RepID=UPI0032DAFAC6
MEYKVNTRLIALFYSLIFLGVSTGFKEVENEMTLLTKVSKWKNEKLKGQNRPKHVLEPPPMYAFEKLGLPVSDGDIKRNNSKTKFKSNFSESYPEKGNNEKGRLQNGVSSHKFNGIKDESKKSMDKLRQTFSISRQDAPNEETISSLTTPPTDESFRTTTLDADTINSVTFYSDDRLLEGEELIEAIGGMSFVTALEIGETRLFYYIKAVSYTIMLVSKIIHAAMSIYALIYHILQELIRIKIKEAQEYDEFQEEYEDDEDNEDYGSRWLVSKQ